MEADLLSKDERDACPSILDIIMSTVGRRMRNIFSAMPGRNPWIKDLMAFLQKEIYIR